ncbi:MAG: beta-N-acetylhexosaminidase [Bacteroidales bacterium]|nr:beta-N-acetylhexosaminidase [Bacteroidales bacterium]MCF8391790.1 beta-N-acetylhexosaminidase [Bacteroidales bacterium]
MKYLFFILMSLSLVSCSESFEIKNSGIIPEPAEVILLKGSFMFTDNLKYVFPESDSVIRKQLELFLYEINSISGKEFKIKNTGTFSKKIIIRLIEAKTNPEAYTLIITPGKILIEASDHHGIHNALQSLKQLVLLNDREGEIIIPSMEIIDLPRFTYRGMHLDVCRHFMTLAEVKKYIDYLSMYKFNTFHWHLTEDQGWRIEIKKYPKLTEVGAWRKETLVGHGRTRPQVFDGIPYGGFYTQNEVKEIVAYATDRYIEVIPEIELPGHARAAIASYPQLGVTGEDIDVMTYWGISPHIYMPSEETFGFLENVLSEVAELFPSNYIHIGGDEALKTQWENSKEVQDLIKKLNLKDEHELQSWFISRIETFLNKKGKKIIGWDEILEGGLAPNATVMSWRGEEGGIAAAKMGHNVIMTPNEYCYFDHYQADKESEPLAIGGFLPLEKVYNYEPVPGELNEEESKFILGAQANVWTEYIPNFKHVEYMIFPRMLAMSEVDWTAPELKNWGIFSEKVKEHEKILDKMGVNYFNK